MRLLLDNGTKFVNLELSKFLKDNGVVHDLMCVNTPQQNGVAEKKNRHLLEVARALLFQTFVLNSQYQRLVGKLIYLSHTRPNIAYGVSVVSQFMHDHRERHLQVVERILHYLKASPGKGLLFRKEEILSVKIYTDANYAGLVVDRRFTSRYCMFMGENLVTWRSKKQNVMKIILGDLKTKRIKIDKHFIKEKLDNELIVTTHVPTRLPATRFQQLNDKLGMIDIHLQTWREFLRHCKYLIRYGR
ncbi:putative mitochondrial protein, partial [Mucuna pruriens]